MVPSSLAGVALFVVLLAPGLAFVLRRERFVPPQDQSAFRETLRVIFVSVVCLALTGLLAAGLRSLYPHRTPDVGALVRSPATFARAHYVQLTWWALALLAFATLVAVVLADPRIARRLKRAGKSRVARWLTGSRYASVSPNPAVYDLMHLYDNTEAGRGPITVSAQMTDGTLVQGSLHSYDFGTDDEEGNREFILSEPKLRTRDGQTHQTGAQFVVVSNRNFTRLDVTHLAPRVTAPSATAGKPWHGILPPDPPPSS